MRRSNERPWSGVRTRRPGAVLAVATLLALVPALAAASVPTVKLRGTSRVRDADNPARHAFHLQTELTFGTGSAQEFEKLDLSSVTGMIFAIENVSEICFVGTGIKLTNVVVLTALAGDQFAVPSYFPPTFTGTFSGTTDEYSANYAVHLYHVAQQGGPPLAIQINRNGTSGPGHCDLTLSGYLLNP